MINSELGHVKSVKAFNKDIKRQQEEAHGEYYCAIHDAIIKYMKECESYIELGTHQGGTASTALLCNPKQIQLVDIDMSRYKKFLQPLAEKYTKNKNIDFRVLEESSLSIKSTRRSDMLVIDSLHHPNHMIQELRLHQININKYIIAHDTSILHGKTDSRLYDCLQTFCLDYPWKIIERNEQNVGYTVLKKK
tara:strand:- start:1470 stop:2045 length:576 start_codon:yes stop_codon:yes gene_type:complete